MPKLPADEAAAREGKNELEPNVTADLADEMARRVIAELRAEVERLRAELGAARSAGPR